MAESKQCRYCAETIKAQAKVCRYCGKGQKRGEVASFEDGVKKVFMIALLSVIGFMIFRYIVVASDEMQNTGIEENVDAVERAVDRVERAND